jgi:hypothetical protein
LARCINKVQMTYDEITKRHFNIILKPVIKVCRRASTKSAQCINK